MAAMRPGKGREKLKQEKKSNYMQASQWRFYIGKGKKPNFSLLPYHIFITIMTLLEPVDSPDMELSFDI